MFVLHLRPNAVRRLHAFLNFILDAHLLQFNLNGDCKLVEEFMALSLCRGQFLLDAGILLWMFVLETEVLQFRLDLIKS